MATEKQIEKIYHTLELLAVAFHRRYGHCSKLLSVGDILNTMVYVYLTNKSDYVWRKTLTLLDKDYDVRRRRKVNKTHFRLNEHFGDQKILRSTIWGTDSFSENDLIDKIFYDDLGRVYEKRYHVNLVALLKEHGYKKRDVAKALGVSDARVQQMLKFDYEKQLYDSWKKEVK